MAVRPPADSGDSRVFSLSEELQPFEMETLMLQEAVRLDESISIWISDLYIYILYIYVYMYTYVFIYIRK